MIWKKNYEEELAKCMKDFELTDFFGFAKLTKVNPETIKAAAKDSVAGKDPIEELFCETIENYSKMSRKERRELLKLAKDIQKENLSLRQEEK